MLYTVRDPPLEKGIALLPVTKIHLEWDPLTGAVQQRHVPRPVNWLGELPQDRITVLIREPLSVRL